MSKYFYMIEGIKGTDFPNPIIFTLIEAVEADKMAKMLDRRLVLCKIVEE